MVDLPTVRSTNAKTVRKQSLVAVFAGGTAGIGECAVRALASAVAKNNGKGVRAYIVGRNQSAAEKIIADCRTVCPKGEFIFVRAEDLSLLRDVDRVCGEIVRLEEERVKGVGSDGMDEGRARVDFLVMTQGIISFKPIPAKEGLDKAFSLAYYSRMRFIVQLLPLLNASALPAHIVSIFNPNFEGKLIGEDIGLRNPANLGFRNGSSHMSQMNTLFMEQIAVKNPSLALIHQFPGAVITEIGMGPDLPAWFRWLSRWVLNPLMRIWAFSAEESGERTLFLASEKFPPRGSGNSGKTGEHAEKGLEIATSPDGMVGGGVYRVDSKGDSISNGKWQKQARADGMGEKVWEHTMEVFRTIESGKVFTG